MNIFFKLPDNLILEFRSESEGLFDDVQVLLSAYIPGITRIDSEEAASFVIEHKEATETYIIQTENKVTLYGSWGKELFVDIYHLIYAVMRQCLLKRGLYSVHGACVGLEDEHVLILGHSGSGKTPVVLKLVQEYGMNVVSGNKTVVAFDRNTLNAIAGTLSISIRESDKAFIGISGGVQYQNRYIFELPPEKIKTPPANIKAMVIVRLNDYSEEVNFLKIPGSLHALYPYFLDVVNADVIIGKSVFVGTPPEGAQQALVENIERALKYIPVYSYIGSASFVAEKISQL